MEIKPIEVLFVDDDPSDVELALEVMNTAKFHLKIQVVNDGEKAIDYLNKSNGYEKATTPDLVLLDLNMPKVTGYDVLSIIKQDEKLRSIPVVVLTSSSENTDIERSYAKGANCYISKPVSLNEFQKVVASIENFWFTVVRLPNNK